MVDAFVDAGLLVTEDHNDRAPNLIKKYRSPAKLIQMKLFVLALILTTILL